MNIFITGGCGYVGTVLTETLLQEGHAITVLDTQWFGDYLRPHKNIRILKDDIRDIRNISLHGYDNESRNILMPVNRKYPFDELMQTCREYIKETKRQITFEYILIKDVTCTDQAVEALRKAFKGMICKMNLIPYNPVAEFGHKTPSREEMVAFRDRLEAFGIHATIRTPRGRDVAAACGQLRHEMSNAMPKAYPS